MTKNELLRLIITTILISLSIFILEFKDINYISYIYIIYFIITIGILVYITNLFQKIKTYLEFGLTRKKIYKALQGKVLTMMLLGLVVTLISVIIKLILGKTFNVNDIMVYLIAIASYLVIIELTILTMLLLKTSIMNKLIICVILLILIFITSLIFIIKLDIISISVLLGVYIIIYITVHILNSKYFRIVRI